MNEYHQSYYEAWEHFNEPVIEPVHHEVVRLVGWGQDSRDCFNIFDFGAPGLRRVTAVGGFISLKPLKGQNAVTNSRGETWDDFVRLEDQLQHRGMMRAEAFILEDRGDEPDPYGEAVPK